MGTLHVFPSSPSLLVPARTLSGALAARRQYVQAEVSALCHTTVRPRLLCIGAEALKEIEDLLPLFNRVNGEVVVADPTDNRLPGVLRPYQLTPVHGDTWSLNRNEWGTFPMIYAPNLLNELKDASAKRAIARLATLLKRGGRLLMTNLSPDLADSGYRTNRAYLRSEEEVATLTQQVPDEQYMGQVVWRDDSRLLVFLEMNR